MDIKMCLSSLLHHPDKERFGRVKEKKASCIEQKKPHITVYGCMRCSPARTYSEFSGAE